ncbi:short-chain dehydrogenase [Xylaria sp. CBS 124048]|nr:short-chain dehydrogenase [Xylaria sp. CBS 124048]
MPPRLRGVDRMGAHFSSMWTQFFPPSPTFTERNVPDLTGRVCLVTGANTGVGKQLARLLYSKNARVYIAARSESKANEAIQDIKKSHPSSDGLLSFLHLDLNDLSSVQASAHSFMSKEAELHVLVNNAGVQNQNRPPKTAQGYEHHLGINTIAPYLFTRLLTPVLAATARAKTAPPGSVRVLWVSSQGTELGGLPSIGVDVDNLDYHDDTDDMTKYALSKTGNWLHAVEYARRHRDDGIISVALNPGNLSSDLYRNDAPMAVRLVIRCLGHPPVRGAYTELYAGFSTDITMEKTGCWVIPFGRTAEIRKDLREARLPKEEGGNGNAARFWKWTEDQVKPYL